MPEIDTKLLQSKIPAFYDHFASEVQGVEDFRGDLCVVVAKEKIKEMAKLLKQEGYEFLMDLFGMDYLKYEPETPERFAVIYGFYSFQKTKRVRLKVFLSEEELSIGTLCGVYRSANWFEREAWDMYGIRFTGHPDLKRILCHHEFEGHALRKDYPSDKYQRLSRPLPSSEM